MQILVYSIRYIIALFYVFFNSLKSQNKPNCETRDPITMNRLDFPDLSNDPLTFRLTQL